MILEINNFSKIVYILSERITKYNNYKVRKKEYKKLQGRDEYVYTFFLHNWCDSREVDRFLSPTEYYQGSLHPISLFSLINFHK